MTQRKRCLTKSHISCLYKQTYQLKRCKSLPGTPKGEETRKCDNE